MWFLFGCLFGLLVIPYLGGVVIILSNRGTTLDALFWPLTTLYGYLSDHAHKEAQREWENKNKG